MRSSVGRSDGTSRKSADDRARGEGRAGGVARRRVAAPPAAPTRRRSSRSGVDVERFGSRGNQRERRDRTFHLRQDALHRAGASGAHHRHLQNDRVAHGRVGLVRHGQRVPGAGRDVRRKTRADDSTRRESALFGKSRASRAHVPAARAIRFPRKTLNASLYLSTDYRRAPLAGACGAAPVRPVRASRARARARRGARVPARPADAVPRRVGRIRRGAVLPSRKA